MFVPVLTSFSTSSRTLLQVHLEVLEDVRGDPAALLDQAEEDVLGPDVLVVEALRLLVAPAP
jgi:hypothetical protein